MKTIFKIYQMTILVMLIVLTSCEKYLEEMPQNRLEPSTIDDYRELLNNAYITTEVIMPYIEALSDDVELIESNHVYGLYGGGDPMPDYGDQLLSAYMWGTTHESSLVGGDRAFSRFYESIFYTNVVIDKIDDALPTVVGDAMTEEKNNIKGEAYALRAYSYFYLVNLYGQYYNPETAETDLGIPVTTSTGAEDKAYTRATVQEVYNQILSDINQAITLMEENPIEKTDKSLFNAFRAKAFASRVALYMNNWDETITISTEVLERNSNVFDLRDAVSFANEANNVSTSTTKLKQGQNYLDEDNSNMIFVNGVNESVPLLAYWPTTTSFTIDTDFAAIFEEGDVRRYYFMGTYIRDIFGVHLERLTLWKHRSFTKNILYMDNSSFTGFTRVIRVEEILLNRAEAYAQNSELQLAINDLNAIREKKFDPLLYVPLSVGSFTKESLLTFIYAERRKELCFEGHRWFDLRRTTRPAISGRIGYYGETASLVQDDPRYVLQVPAEEIDINPGIGRAPR